MKVSVVMASYQKAYALDHVLFSICKQGPQPGEVEVIVVDDGSEDRTATILNGWAMGPLKGVLRWVRLDRPGVRGASLARNVGYRMAQGEIIIAQSPDVVHDRLDTITRLSQIEPGTFVIAKVWNHAGPWPTTDLPTDPFHLYTAPSNPRPFFFLGSLWRKDLYAIGGDDEDFTDPGYEDDFFADRLIHGLGLKPVFSETIVGYHLDHKREGRQRDEEMKAIYLAKHLLASTGRAPWVASGGAWPWK